MRKTLRWYIAAFSIAFVVIGAAHLLRGRPLAHAASEALVWASISAAIYASTRLYRTRQGQDCALCVTLERGDKT